MEVNDELIEKLANLSKLKFDEKEKEAIKADLQKMISFVEKLNELDLKDVEPLLHMNAEKNNWRKDEIKGSVDRDEALKNAPQKDDRFFKVPKVIKKS